MAIQSMDAIIAAISAGKFQRSDFNKNALPTTAQVAGQWYDLSTGGGNPIQSSIIGAGTNLTFQAISDTTSVTATTAALGGSIATTVFTDTTHGTGRFTVGSVLTGTGVAAGTYIVSLGTGTGANAGGTYNVNISQTVTSQTITATQTPSGIDHGGIVSTDIKHIANASMFSAAATTAPAVMMLIDQIAVFPISSVTTTGAQTMLGTQTLPRYADGKGVRAYLVPSVVMGAGTPTVQLSYTNTASVAGRLTPASPSLPIINTTAPVGSIPYSGTGVGKYGPFLPLAAGDSGILSVQSVNFSATMVSGCMNLVLCRPLLTLPITTVGVASERDLLNQLPSLPRVYDGANLQWLMYAGAATPVNSSFYGNLDFLWG
ncbi:MAG TPA: hypothetical protein PKY40_07730 [Burkholderiaceae bacterium]|nr:hypothetical protein [Burkholderiaceae bacterium]